MTRDPIPLKDLSCPGCGRNMRRATRILGTEQAPKPGQRAVCGGCGALLQFNDRLRFVLVGQLPDDLSPAEKIHLTQLWSRMSAGNVTAGYELAVVFVARALQRWLSEFPDDPPRFAMLPKEIFLAATLNDIGGAIARNEAARLVIDAAIGFCNAAGTAAPTISMLRMALDDADLSTEEASLADLGIVSKDAPS